MTTSVGNNSVFRSFFEKQKLTGPNFIEWYRQLRLVLSTEDKENYLEHLILAAPVAPPGQQVPPQALAAHVAWVKGKKEVAELKAMYSKQAEQELLQTVREFHTSKQKECQSVSSHVLKMKATLTTWSDSVNHLVRTLHCMKKRCQRKMLILHFMQYEQEGFRKNQKNKSHKAAKGCHGKGKGKMGHASNNAPFSPKPKTPPPPKKDNPSKDAICHQCGQVGHWRRNCPVKSWIYDIGCGTHICITTHGLQGSKKLKPGTLSLYVGDGHRAAVEAIGTYHLELPSGLVIVLNNCHYATSITRGYPKETMGYSFYNPSENKVFVARNAEFFESKLLDLKASGSVEDLELIQEEDTNPSVDNSLNHKEDDQEIKERQSDINPIRKSSRTCHFPDIMCLYIDAEEHELGDLGKPANYKAVKNL
nr:hypothetical protein [Tanacetum cinerariifolium]